MFVLELFAIGILAVSLSYNLTSGVPVCISRSDEHGEPRVHDSGTHSVSAHPPLHVSYSQPVNLLQEPAAPHLRGLPYSEMALWGPASRSPQLSPQPVPAISICLPEPWRYWPLLSRSLRSARPHTSGVCPSPAALHPAA